MDVSGKTEIRHNAIKELLLINNFYSIDDFCHDLKVSEATIRNDLTYLEKQGKLRRVKGGAIAILGTMYETVYARRSSMHTDEKLKIARYIVDNVIKEGMLITLDSGSTCRMIAEAIVHKKRKCTVITNSLATASFLVKSPVASVHLAGGKYNRENDSFHDELTVEAISRFHSDVFFLSPDGIDTDLITTEYNTEHFVKQEMIKQSGSIIVVGDYSKLGVKCLKKICETRIVDRIITDDKASDKIRKKFKEAGVSLEIAK
ncbi:MAG: DeoR/GlpR family DNA-binding transcription regulator [Erysipelotrichaceae bacterium]|nr:DeoR/GlpR family DNA-binding transcription regulator [Erysipelotrichaceae bacterium]